MIESCGVCGGNPFHCYCGKIIREALEDLKNTIQPSAIHHPGHYQGNKLEVIDIIEDFQLDFLLGNAVKYILRAGKKDDILQDLNKAIWYLNRKCQKIKETRDTNEIKNSDGVPKL